MGAETDEQIRERLHRVLGLPPGTHRATYTVREMCRLENEALSTGYLKIQRGETPVMPNTGRARGKRIPATWVIARYRNAHAAEVPPEPAPPPGTAPVPSVASLVPPVASVAPQAAAQPAAPAVPNESPIRESLRQMLRQELGALLTAPSG